MDRNHEPPTEPLASEPPRLKAPSDEAVENPSIVPPPPLSQTTRAFSHRRYHFTSGVRAGQTATIRDDSGATILTYRSFASIVGIVAILVSAIVALAGLAAVAFLIAEEEPLRAAAVALLTIAFAFFIALLVPRIQVTLYDDARPALTIRQERAFPTACYAVRLPDATPLAELHKSVFSRLGRNRWTIRQDGRLIGTAEEESLGRALVRKVAGKFSRRFETDVRIDYGGIDAGRVIRRAGRGDVDVLELTSDVLDPRIAVALATLILGREP